MPTQIADIEMNYEGTSVGLVNSKTTCIIFLAWILVETLHIKRS